MPDKRHDEKTRHDRQERPSIWLEKRIEPHDGTREPPARMRERVTRFTVEQPAKLNPLVDDTIPLNWCVRWRNLKAVLPLIGFSSVCLVELTFVRLWLAEKVWDSLWSLLFACVFPPLTILIGFEVETHLRHRRSRRLTLKRSGLQFGSGDSFCPWRTFAGLRFYPIAGQPHLKRCAVLRKDRHRSIGEWPRVSLALDAEQQQALVRAVQDYRPADLGEIRIEEQQQPARTLRPGPLFFKAAAIYMLGLYLLLHGGTLMAVFWPGRKPERSNRTSEFVITERRAEQLADFLVRHFRSKEEFQASAFCAGAILTLAGITSLMAGRSLFRRDRRQRLTGPSCQIPCPTESAAPQGNSEPSPGSPKQRSVGSR